MRDDRLAKALETVAPCRYFWLFGAACCVTATLIVSAATARAEEPRTAYWLHCAGCHLLDGRGAPPEVPTLIDTPGRIAALPGGRQYLMQIPGVALAGLDNERLAAVLNFMLEEFSANSLAQDFQPYSASEVGEHRLQVLQDPLKRRAEIFAGPGFEPESQAGGH